MGGCGSLFICLSLCLSVSTAREWVWGDVGGEGGLSTVREEQEVAGGSQSRTI